MFLKSKIYLKPGEKPPKEHEVKRGPKGGLYYETRVKLAPAKALDLKTLHIDEIIHRLPKLTQDELHSLIDDERYYIRSRITNRLDQKGLHQMIHDKEPEIRANVVKRIDQSGLHEMINDEDSFVLEHVANRIDTEGLKEMSQEVGGIVSGIVRPRLLNIAKIAGMLYHYNKTGEIELSSDMKKEISKIVENDASSTEMLELIDEFYKHTPFAEFHQESKDAWESSSSSSLSGLLKDSILRQFGGKIRHHDAITDWKKFTEDLYAQYPKEMVDKYVQTHKKLTCKILDVMFPDQDTIMLFRGTTKNEAISEVKRNENVSLQANPLSSWTQRHDIALKFSDKENGITVRTLVHKDDIWATFMSHAYQGMEREFLVISPKNRQGTVMKC